MHRSCSVLIVVGLLTGEVAAQQLPAGTARGLYGGWEGEMQSSPWLQFLTLTLVPEQPDSISTLEILGQKLKAADLRVGVDSVAMRIGEGERAVLLDAVLGDERLVGTLRQGSYSAPFTLRRIPELPAPRDRVEAWAQDIDALTSRFLELDRSFSPDERARFLAHLSDTRARLAELHDNEIIVRLASAIALANNAHTRLYLLRNATELRRLPIRLWWFSDGLYVVRATPAYAELLGCRIVDIAGTPARQARERVSPAFAGTASWREYMSLYMLTSPETLHGFRITPSPDSVEISVSGCGRGTASRVTIKPLPLVRRDNAVEAWWDLSPRHPGIDSSWKHVLSAHDSLPAYLRKPTSNYWFENLPERGVLYFQYNRAQNGPGESTSEFGVRLLKAMEEHEPRAFVMDVRFNTGGNLSLASDLMQKLEERTRGIPRFIVTGRTTFSAGISHVAEWRERGDVTIVGEPVGDELEMWSEGGNVRLPNSGFKAHFANGLHSYSPTPCPPNTPCRDLSSPSVAPDLPARASWTEYLALRDPAMEAVFANLTGSIRE